MHPLWTVEPATMAVSARCLARGLHELRPIPPHDLTGVKHPISLASRVLAHARIPDQLGRLPPMYVPRLNGRSLIGNNSRVLVSDGARKFAAADTKITQPDELIALRARDEWKSWKSRLGSSSEPNNQSTGLHDLQDTVGAVTWVEGDGTAAGVSR